MLERLRGLSRGDLYLDYRRRLEDTANPITPTDVADYHDAFVENAALNPYFTEERRRELKENGLASINNFEPVFRDDVLKIIDERGEARLNKQFELADQAIAEAVAHDKPLYEAAIAAAEFHNLKNDPRVRALFRDARGFQARQKANQSTFRKAGVPFEMIDNELGAKLGVNNDGEAIPLRTLKGNKTTNKKGKTVGETVPQPIIFNYDGNEFRVHTKYELNPFTEQIEVVPYLNPGTSNALVTEFGQLDNVPLKAGGSDPQASEYVALNAAKLMQGNKKVIFNPGHHKNADLIVTKNDGSTQNVDAMITYRGKGRYKSFDDSVQIPRYTNLQGVEGNNKLKADIELLVSQGFSTEEAVESLFKAGKIIERNRNDRHGKLHKGDINYVDDVDSIYDKLLISGYDMNTINSSRFKTDTYAEPPVSLHMLENIKGLADDVRSGKVSPSMNITQKNKGARGDGSARLQIQEVFPQNNPRFSDMTKMHPYTQQILKNWMDYVI